VAVWRTFDYDGWLEKWTFMWPKITFLAAQQLAECRVKVQ
jgi:hypothetical protein